MPHSRQQVQTQPPETPATSKNIDNNPETGDNIGAYALLFIAASASLVTIKCGKQYIK